MLLFPDMRDRWLFPKRIGRKEKEEECASAAPSGRGPVLMELLGDELSDGRRPSCLYTAS